jgi:periodic tryptophan protein 1
LYLHHPFLFSPLQIPRGAAKRVPIKQLLSSEEVEAIKSNAKKETALEDTSDDDVDNAEVDLLQDPAFASLKDVNLPFSVKERDNSKPANAQTLSKEDIPTGISAIDEAEELSDEEEDVDDLIARPSDAFLLVANTEDEYSSLEVHVFNQEDDSLYVHHDITLPSFPLCLAWCDYAGSAYGELLETQASMFLPSSTSSAKKHTTGNGGNSSYVGSFVAVGTFHPDIEIWNTDVLDPLEPALTLHGSGSDSSKGGSAKDKKKASKKSSSSNSSTSTGTSTGHSDAVLGLAWNHVHRHLLASCSADKTAKVWDLDHSGRVLHTFKHHKGKVHNVAWNPVEHSILALASYDLTASVVDARSPDSNRVAKYALPSEVEAMLWNTHAPSNLLLSCDNGQVLSFDVRNPSSPLFTLQAHSAATTSLSLSLLAKGLLVTGSLDKTVKVWDLGVNATDSPTHIATKQVNIGQVFSTSFFPNDPFFVAVGGSKGILAIWDIVGDSGEVSDELNMMTPISTSSSSPASSYEFPPDASVTSKRFLNRIVDPSTVPSLAIRQRTDNDE